METPNPRPLNSGAINKRGEDMAEKPSRNIAPTKARFPKRLALKMLKNSSFCLDWRKLFAKKLISDSLI